MDRREFLRRSAAGAVTFRAHGRAQGSRKPNILLLLAGSWRGQALASAGDRNARTPNLARLAAEGVQFSRAYTANPDCSPARAAILTGRLPHMCGVPADGVRLPPGEATLSRLLAEAGYATGYIGKWDLDGEEQPGYVPPGDRRHGFSYWAAFNRGNRYYESVYFRDNDTPIRGAGFEPDYQTDLAIEFIREHASRPFFLCVSWGPPHPPRKPPPPFESQLDASKLVLRGNVPSGSAERTRNALTGYYGLCAALDANVGRLMRALDEAGASSDTIVVFTSDHGDMAGSHGLDQHRVPFEESVRIPLLVRYPGRIRNPASSDVPASGIDLAPTLLSLAGLPIPSEMQGVDLAGQLTGEGGERPEAVYCQGQLGTPAEWRMVVRGLDKIVVDRNLRITQLHNLGQDPYELVNLADDSGERRKRDEMRAILRDWMRRMSDQFLPSGLRLRS